MPEANASFLADRDQAEQGTARRSRSRSRAARPSRSPRSICGSRARSAEVQGHSARRAQDRSRQARGPDPGGARGRQLRVCGFMFDDMHSTGNLRFGIICLSSAATHGRVLGRTISRRTGGEGDDGGKRRPGAESPRQQKRAGADSGPFRSGRPANGAFQRSTITFPRRH